MTGLFGLWSKIHLNQSTNSRELIYCVRRARARSSDVRVFGWFSIKFIETKLNFFYSFELNSLTYNGPSSIRIALDVRVASCAKDILKFNTLTDFSRISVR